MRPALTPASKLVLDLPLDHKSDALTTTPPRNTDTESITSYNYSSLFSVLMPTAGVRSHRDCSTIPKSSLLDAELGTRCPMHHQNEHKFTKHLFVTNNNALLHVASRFTKK